MTNHYINSWELYKAHTELFKDDFDYYENFCLGFKTLELFSGYGRLTNFLISKGIDIQSVELEPKFAQLINLPSIKNHVGNVLKFTSSEKYERIIAAYNSFCLLLDEIDIKNFFNKLDELLLPGGYISLSYYPITSWKKSPPEEIIFKNQKIHHTSTFDFNNLDNNIAIWIDEYSSKNLNYKFEYPTRVYKNSKDVQKFIIDTNLKLINILHNYNKEMQDAGWVEYIFTK